MTGEGLNLYELVPSLYRMRDTPGRPPGSPPSSADQPGGPLQTLLAVIQENLAALETDIALLYDDWFIETCRDEVIGLFAELLGVRLSTAPSTAAPDPVAASGFADARRRQVANALAHRRRKGTLTVLDAVTADVTGWPMRTQELRRRVSVTQSARHPDLARGRLVDVGDGDRLDRLATPFDPETVLADMRRVDSHRSRGAANPSSVAIVLWRLLTNGADRGEAYCVDDDTHFTFDPLGRDVALAVRPQPRRAGTAPAADLDVAAPITRQALHRRLEDYYGPDRSVAIYVGNSLVPRERIVAADLSDSRVRIGHGRVALDPVLGRFAFAARPSTDKGVTVRYRQLQPAPIGGGSYPRTTPPRSGAVYRVASHGGEAYRKVSSAIRRWRTDRDRGYADPNATIEILDDATYTEHYALRVQVGETLEIRAAPGRRPVLRPVDDDHDRPDRFWVDGLAAPTGKPTWPLPRVTFDGITVAGHAVALRGALGQVTFRHTTLVPGSWRGDPAGPGPMTIDVEAMPCRITIASSIVGRIEVDSPETGFDPIPVSATDSILDGRGGPVIGGTDGRDAYIALDLHRVTVLGEATVHSLGMVQDCLFTRPLICEHRQTGQIRFSSLPVSSRTPRRTSCQPDGVIGLVDPRLSAAERRTREAAETRRVRPVFDSVQLSTPGYARLADGNAEELRRGGHDGGEMGAHHDLWLARRIAELQIRLEEFTPAGIDCGPLFAT